MRNSSVTPTVYFPYRHSGNLICASHLPSGEQVFAPAELPDQLDEVLFLADRHDFAGGDHFGMADEPTGYRVLESTPALVGMPAIRVVLGVASR